MSGLIELTESEYHAHREEYDGYCLACGEWTCGGVEPDARGYECESCGAMRVFGCEELMIMGRIDIDAEESGR